MCNSLYLMACFRYEVYDLTRTCPISYHLVQNYPLTKFFIKLPYFGVDPRLRYRDLNFEFKMNTGILILAPFSCISDDGYLIFCTLLTCRSFWTFRGFRTFLYRW